MSSPFVNMFAGNPLDRAGDRRSDPAWIEARRADPSALAVILRDGEPLLEKAGEEGLRIAYVRADQAGSGVVFLGLWKETPVFAAEAGETGVSELLSLGAFEDLRMSALALPPAEAAICATAKALFEWHARHGFCARCGAASVMTEGGWKRVCPACGAEHFPRTDPVVIMLAVHGGRCLLGHNAKWPARMFSALAGFVEPGESLEEACARELKEEAGLVATAVRYVSSQPWPYPSSLMVGLIAQVDGDMVVPDADEVAEHHWLTKDEARAMLAGDHPDIRPISPVAIARTLVEAWVGE